MKSKYTLTQRVCYGIGYTIGIVRNLGMTVAYAPLLVFETARTIYYRRKVAKQIGPNATPFERGYASAPYMVKQHGRKFMLSWVIASVLNGSATDFHRGVNRWLVEHAGELK